MGTVTLLPADNHRAFADFADPNKLFTWDQATLELIIPSAVQQVLDGKLIAYHANQANIDAAFAVTRAAQATAREERAYTEDGNLNAVVEVMRVELNELRARFSGPPLPDITEGQMDAKVRAEIANP